MRASRTLRLCHATESQAGSMRGSRRKTATSILRVAGGRVDGSDEGASSSTPHPMEGRAGHMARRDNEGPSKSPMGGGALRGKNMILQRLLQYE